MKKIKLFPEVFIVESLMLDDEKKDLFEGKIISQILHLNGKHSIYYYIRTVKELVRIIELFDDSKYRYLHFSCHGSSNAMHTTFDQIPFEKLGEILRPKLKYKRLFVSACSMTNKYLAKSIIPGSYCNSIVGPKEAVPFKDAAILWASFYHLMFSANYNSMKREEILKNISSIANLYGVPLNCYYKTEKAKIGYRFRAIIPNCSLRTVPKVY